MSSLLPSTNISFYTIPLAWILGFLPRIYAKRLYESKTNKEADLTQPRIWVQKLADDQTLDQATKDTIIRAEGAQANTFENIGLFAAAIVAGNMANLSTSYMNALSMGYIASRILYTFIYVNNVNKTMAQGRSVVFITGLGLCMAMFVSAGRKLGG